MPPIRPSGFRYDPQKAFMGVDPGQKGGIALLGSRVETWAMPDTEREIWDLIKSIPQKGNVHAVIEKVHSMPSQGVASSFKFGVNYGIVRMALVAAGIPFEEIDPRTWMKTLSIPPRKQDGKRDFKKRLLRLAQQMFPSLELWNTPRSLGKQLAVCDALLIAESGRRRYIGNEGE